MATPATHRWQFSRAGGFDQARLESAQDLAQLEELDLKLWAALACPVKGLEFDERTLQLVDTDGDGRVRAPEVIAALKWCDERLKDLALLKAGSESLPMAQINGQTAAGQAVLASARQVLAGLGKADASTITLADVNDMTRSFAKTRLNGDGIVTADTAEEDATRAVIEEALATVGSVPDRSGRPGLDQALLERFFSECAAWAAWRAEGQGAALRPLGEATAAACAAWSAVRAKVDDYFARCRLAAFDGRALAALNRREEEYLAIAAQDLTVSAQEVAGFPLTRIEAGRPLPLAEGLNPAWSAAIEAFRAAAVAPLLGKGQTSLTGAEWSALGAKLAPYADWAARQPPGAVARLGEARIAELLAGDGREKVAALIAADLALAGDFAAIIELERLLRYHRDLYRLLCNFVNFSDFYSRERRAVFQAGTLYLDGRSCDLVVRVDDAGKHAALAGLAKCYLAYCDCTRPTGEKLQIAAAFTGGDSDYLMVGRNGLFFDRKGRDWDATITRVVENPISIRQAFWSPYKKLVRLIEEQVAKRAAAKEAESDAKLASTAGTAAGTAAPPAKKIDVGTVAAISVAIAGIGALITTLIGYMAGLFTLPFWQLALVLAGVLLLISTPSMLIAWLKLRQRNLGPILDANGWAVNGRVKLNVRFGGSLTKVAALPEGSIPAADPFGEKPSPWPKLIQLVVAVWFVLSFCNSQGWIWALTQPGSAFHDAAGFSLGDRMLSDEELAAKEAAEQAAADPAAAAPPARTEPAAPAEAP
ncbi:MAG TPA: hypothetical protein VFD43_04680, partial [Planctomycetota bacterium]|nr:hypothetical protein [Planctomycetota bacterium]